MAMRNLILASLALFSAAHVPAFADTSAPTEADAVVKDYVFSTGERLPELKIHYTTLGSPKRDASGNISNAIMILHGTGGTGHQFFQPQFAGELFGLGQVLDISKYFIILPDNVGHGKSSKPSDGLRMAFPKYDYTDMIATQHQLVTKTLGI
jgi:homoserine O-acetyltransferase